MSSMEKEIQQMIDKMIQDGIIQQKVEEHFQKGLDRALDHVFSSYGDVSRTIEGKIKETIVPYLERYDYSEYLTKFDDVLVNILQQTAVPHKELLENFQELVQPMPDKKIEVSDLFEKWKEYVADSVETDNLEVIVEDDVSYESVDVTMTFEEDERPTWSSIRRGNIVFECEQDESMNVSLEVMHFDHMGENEWHLDHHPMHNLNSLRSLNTFQILLMKIKQQYSDIVMDVEFDEDTVVPDAEPEPSFG